MWKMQEQNSRVLDDHDHQLPGLADATNQCSVINALKKKKRQITRVEKILKIAPVSKTTCENYGLFLFLFF